MQTLATKQIKEIAEQLDCGFRAFIHKQTNELIFVPNDSRFYDIDKSAWQDEFDKVEEKYTEYYEIEGIESPDSFQVMADFTEQLSDTNLQSKLYNALNKRHPFRAFKFVIDNSGEQRKKWFDFKNRAYYEWAEQQLRKGKTLD